MFATHKPHLWHRHSLVMELGRARIVSQELQTPSNTYKMKVLLPLTIKLYGSQDTASVSPLLVALHVNSNDVNATKSLWNRIIEGKVECLPLGKKLRHPPRNQLYNKKFHHVPKEVDDGIHNDLYPKTPQPWTALPCTFSSNRKSKWLGIES